MGRGAVQPTNSAATTSTAPPARGTPAPVGRGAAMGGKQNSGGPIRFYAMRRRRESESSPDVVIGILSVQSHDLHEPFSVSTLIGESILAVQVYRDSVVTLCGRDTVADLIELRMVDFDVIMEMDWIYSCFSKLDYRTRTVRFEFPNEPVIEWKSDDMVLKGKANGVADALSRKSMGSLAHLEAYQRSLAKEVH
ncbi:uncharacterized protein [Nicotiana tomentosiformis]|uniref:uncharacterized protein n=1 Tax=Nicotiana tomentosiformis TaxID=4098 RepID=UPI00388CD8C6